MTARYRSIAPPVFPVGSEVWAVIGLSVVRAVISSVAINLEDGPPKVTYGLGAVSGFAPPPADAPRGERVFATRAEAQSLVNTLKEHPEGAGPILTDEEWVARAETAYRDDTCLEKDCEYCNKTYRGSALYCSHDCAKADA